jgi:hypothetical protein
VQPDGNAENYATHDRQREGVPNPSADREKSDMRGWEHCPEQGGDEQGRCDGAGADAPVIGLDEQKSDAAEHGQ